ncbi:hypothetical protein PINS_up008124 [Pythium insidiosum]|nr:hypothetical protein PINS_up008124 [Pythium insidiosum]
MEFMDLGTGILTMKSELVEDPERLFALASAVLHGFLQSLFVLPEQQFHDLFVKESDVINTWEDYERLIAMLVEQLILRSYVAHREKEAADQMEALLREVSLADEAPRSLAPRKTTTKKKKKKKLNAKAKVKESKLTPTPMAPTECADGTSARSTDAITSYCDVDCDAMDVETPTESESEPEHEADTSQLLVETEEHDDTVSDAVVPPPRPTLNPDAVAFQPTTAINVALHEKTVSTTGKRKLDDFILRVPWDDVDEGDEGEGDDSSIDSDSVDDAFGYSADLGCRNGERDAELESHLQYMYASVSAMYGWDFERRCEVDVPPCGPWSHHALWQTAPQDVVRYYFPPMPSTARPPPGAAFGAPLLPGFVFPAGTEAVAGAGAGAVAADGDGVPPRLQSSFPVPTIGPQWVPQDVAAPSSRYFFAPPQEAPPVSYWDPSVENRAAAPAGVKPTELHVSPTRRPLWTLHGRGAMASSSAATATTGMKSHESIAMDAPSSVRPRKHLRP